MCLRYFGSSLRSIGSFLLVVLLLSWATPCTYSLSREDFSESSREDLVVALIELEGILSELESENERLQNQLGEAENELSEAESESTRLQLQLTEVRSSLSEAETSLSKYETQTNRQLRRTRVTYALGGAGVGVAVYVAARAIISITR